MKVHLGSPSDARGLEPDIASVAQRLDIDDLEHVADRSGQGEVDRLPFHRRAEIGHTDHPSGDVDRFDHSGSGREFDLLV